MNKKNDAQDPHPWRFFRSGGFDQVAIETGEDLRSLEKLDLKLWTALNCPATGLEFDERTLALVDADGDGQIRVPELLAAVRWSCEMLTDPQVMFSDAGLPVSAIDASHSEGAGLHAAAVKVLEYLEKSPDSPLVVGDFADMTRLFSPDHFNGDGVVTAALTDDASLQALIGEIMATQGEVADRSGAPGITAGTLEAFYAQAQAVVDWHGQSAADAEHILPLGEGTAAGAALFESVRAKVDDFFTRCRLAAYDASATEALNPPASVYCALGDRDIAAADDDVAALPLAEIVADRPLPLAAGLNPAWAGAIGRLRDEVVGPILGPREALAQEDWELLSARFSAYRQWQADKPETAVHGLDLEHVREILSGQGRERLAALIEEDLAADTSAGTVDALERLVRYQRDLVTLLRNFVTLSDFYSGERKAIFQAGTLYLDQRSCELVMRVADMGRHATMAPFSGCYLVYCDCVRKGSPSLSIVAALTNGEVDELMVPGRNGVFYDRAGRDWKATVVKVVEQPISIRQAFWSPYRRLARFIENQIQKFAASRDKDIESRTTAGVSDAAAQAGAGQTPAAQAFDIAKFAGVFAAIGLAIGAIGTALVAMLTGLFSLAWWQVPLVLLVMALLISTPSMLLAYLTLRRRNLGPLLDANGWAVNARARINVPFGAALTGIPVLPAGSSRSLSDPFAEKKRPWKTWLLLLMLVIIAIVLWRQGVFDGLRGGVDESAVEVQVEVTPDDPNGA